MTNSLLFDILVGMVFVWAALYGMLYFRLKNAHPRAYRSMGSPTLWSGDESARPFNAFRFVFSRGHKALDDPLLSLLSDFMALFVAAYGLVFCCLFFSIWM
jgi:hypothetical protein